MSAEKTKHVNNNKMLDNQDINPECVGSQYHQFYYY